MKTRLALSLVLRGAAWTATTAAAAALVLPAAHAFRPQAGGPPPADDNGGFSGQGGFGGQGGPGGGGFGGPNGGGGGGRRGGFGQGGPMAMARDVKAFQVPAATLASLLHLDSSQKAQVATAISHFTTRMQALRQSAMNGGGGNQNGGFSGQGGFNGGGNGPQGGPGGGMLDRTQMDAITRSASSEINNALNDAQKQRLPSVLAAIRVLRDGNVPIPLTGQLGLSDDQIDRLGALAPKDDANGQRTRPPMAQQRSQNGMKTLPTNVASLLTDAQKTQIEPWLADLPGANGMGGVPGMGPQMAFGGPRGGFGGPGGGGPGGQGGGFGGPNSGGPGEPSGDGFGAPPPPPGQDQ